MDPLTHRPNPLAMPSQVSQLESKQPRSSALDLESLLLSLSPYLISVSLFFVCFTDHKDQTNRERDRGVSMAATLAALNLPIIRHSCVRIQSKLNPPSNQYQKLSSSSDTEETNLFHPLKSISLPITTVALPILLHAQVTPLSPFCSNRN